MSKRAMETNAVVEENEKSLYAIFRDTANLLSQFYSQSIANQKLAFEAGESYALLEIHEWMLGKMREGRIITVPDIIGYLQAKMDSLAGVNRQPAEAGNASGQNSASAAAGMASLAPVEQGRYPGMASLAPVEQGSYPGMGTSSVAPVEQGGYQECSFDPEDLFSPEELNSFLEMTGVCSSEQDSYPDAQMGGM